MIISRKELLRSFILLGLIFCGLSSLAIGQANPSEEISDSVQTAKGKLKIIKVTDGDAVNIKIELDNKVIKDGTESPYVAGSVFGKYPQKSPSLFLVRLTNDSTACAAGFIIIDLSGKSATASKEFGNCGDSPLSVYRNQSLLITFPAGKSGDAYKKGGREVWQFRRGKLSKTK
ncbi:MAG: hypothetical protein H0X72_08055 [Acidobacteria bacterium]|jgi:hypothetical protein|nr:hypothetical protein [Acidobacteriota bacterium]